MEPGWAADHPTESDWYRGHGATMCFGNKGANHPGFNQAQEAYSKASFAKRQLGSVIHRL